MGNLRLSILSKNLQGHKLWTLPKTSNHPRGILNYINYYLESSCHMLIEYSGDGENQSNGNAIIRLSWNARGSNNNIQCERHDSPSAQ